MKIISSAQLLFLSILPFLGNAPLQAATYLTPGPVSGQSGEVLDVPVYFSSDDSVVGAEFILKFDPSAIKAGGIRKGSSISDHEIFDDQDTEGELKMTILSMKNDKLADGNLTIVSFTLLKDLAMSPNHLTIDSEETLLVSKAAQSFDFGSIEPITQFLAHYSDPIDDSRPAYGREITFNTDPSPLTSYSWDMGDGTVLTGNVAKHTYSKADDYLITITGTNPFGSAIQTMNLSVDARYWELDATDLGNGWKSFDWFGNYFEGTGSPWIFHQSLGWLYRHGDKVDDTWLWSEAWAWTWTNDQLYPYLNQHSGDWLYYFKGTTNPVRYYDYGISAWLEQ